MEQKIENLLEVSFAANEEEISNSPQLNAGFDKDNKTWEVIAKFSRNFDAIIKNYEKLGITGYELLGNFGIFRGSKVAIEAMAEDARIDYIEKPKRLFFALEEEKASICLNDFGVKNNLSFLSGAGVLVAIIDTGLDIFDGDFRNGDGTTRVEWLWDQTLDGNMTKYGYGIEYSKSQINSALEDGRRITTDFVMHGTNVAAIACGNRGVAPNSSIICVKLAVGKNDGFSWTTQMMAAIDYVVRKSIDMDMPIAINISLGSNYGSHRGDTLLEQYIDNISNYGKNIFCVGCGNEAASPIHKSVTLKSNDIYEIELVVASNETSVSFQIWAYSWDEISSSIVSPSGNVFGPLNNKNVLVTYQENDTEILAYVGEATPVSVLQEVYYDFIPRYEYINSGIWKIVIKSGKIKSGKIDMWLQSGDNFNVNTGFVEPDAKGTITIPATAKTVISVGAYNQSNNAYATFSGRGLSGAEEYLIKPDLVAPGVDIGIRPGKFVTGTSFATPFVTGAAALLMEQGIVMGKDKFMYGQKLKAKLIKAALPLPGENIPNDKIGWGKVCIIT